MNSSYFAVPGRGGASPGIPPAQTGIASLTPAASFSLMPAQPLRPIAGSATANNAAIWRRVTGISSALQSSKVDLRHPPSDGWGRPRPRLVRSFGAETTLWKQSNWRIFDGLEYYDTMNLAIRVRLLSTLATTS